MGSKGFGIIGFFVKLLVVAIIAAGAFVAFKFYSKDKTIEQLLKENTSLKEAITNLTTETQIGYARVISQQERQGVLYTKLLFVETDRHDPLKRILEKEYEIEGDVIHFDALIVKFDSRLVMDGKERAMYLWRRVYGEKMQPEQGFAIESQGSESARYADICGKLSVEDRSLFWTNIWALADDTEKLSKAGVRAIYGNVVYRRLRPGLIYIFKIDASGGLFYESVPAL